MIRESELNKIVTLSMLLSLSIVLQIVEGLIPIPFLIPGIKLGLANIIIIIILYKYGYKYAITIGLLRVIIASMLRNGFGINFIFSIVGVLMSITIMNIFIKKSKLSMIGVSMAGSNFHIIGQLIMASLIYKSNIFYITHLPIMLIISLITGFIIGELSNKLYEEAKL